jgi:hypothetical protein
MFFRRISFALGTVSDVLAAGLGFVVIVIVVAVVVDSVSVLIKVSVDKFCLAV